MTVPAPAPVRRDFPAWIYITSFFLIVVIALLPMLTTFTAIGIANAYDCQVDESGLHPCLIGGTDYGEWLQAGAMSFWFILVSMPAGFVLFIGWLIVFILHLRALGKKRKPAT